MLSTASPFPPAPPPLPLPAAEASTSLLAAFGVGGAPDGDGPQGAVLALEAPRAWTSEVLGGLAPAMLAGGRALYCVDAGNSFDPYAFSRFARRRGRAESELLDRVFVTRAFTIHQLEAAAKEMLEPLARGNPPVRGNPPEQGGPRPMAAVLGLDHLFLEETLGMRERRGVLERVLGSLRRARDGGLLVVAAHDPPRPGRGWMHPLIAGAGDARAVARRDGDGAARVRLGRGSPFLD